MGGSALSSRAIIGMFYEELEKAIAADWTGLLSMDFFQSDMEVESYKWLGMSPAMREWVGGRQAKGLRDNGITITNKTWEATLEILVDWIRRDKTGQIRVRIADLAGRAVAHWASLLSTLIINAESTVCYDGQYFFDTDHSEGSSGTLNNDLTADISTFPASVHGVVTAPSVEEMQQTILNAIAGILGFKDDQGEPMNEGAQNFLVMAPVALMSPVLAATKNPIVGASTNLITNITGDFSIKPAINPRLTWTDKIAVFRTDGATKAFIRQEEEGLTINAIAEGSEEEFNNNRHLYGVKAIRNVGYGFWQKACLIQMI